MGGPDRAKRLCFCSPGQRSKRVIPGYLQSISPAAAPQSLRCNYIQQPGPEVRIGSGYLLATFQARGVGVASPLHKPRSLLGSWSIAQNSWFLTQTIQHFMRQLVPYNCDMCSAIPAFVFGRWSSERLPSTELFIGTFVLSL